MIFIGGIHGVGKSFFCNDIKSKCGICTYSASQLIEESRGLSFSSDKRISDIDENQAFLLEQVKQLKLRDPFFLLEGHFCLLNEEGEISRVPKQTFLDLGMEAIILLIGNPRDIKERRKSRDGIIVDESAIDCFQQEEVKYAKEIADYLKIPLQVFDVREDACAAMDYVLGWR